MMGWRAAGWLGVGAPHGGNKFHRSPKESNGHVDKPLASLAWASAQTRRDNEAAHPNTMAAALGRVGVAADAIGFRTPCLGNRAALRCRGRAYQSGAGAYQHQP